MNKQRTPKGKPQGQARYRQTVSGAEVATTTPLQNANNYLGKVGHLSTDWPTATTAKLSPVFIFIFYETKLEANDIFSQGESKRKKKLLPKVV